MGWLIVQCKNCGTWKPTQSTKSTRCLKCNKNINIKKANIYENKAIDDSSIVSEIVGKLNKELLTGSTEISPEEMEFHNYEFTRCA